MASVVFRVSSTNTMILCSLTGPVTDLGGHPPDRSPRPGCWPVCCTNPFRSYPEDGLQPVLPVIGQWSGLGTHPDVGLWPASNGGASSPCPSAQLLGLVIDRLARDPPRPLHKPLASAV